jgi:transposase
MMGRQTADQARLFYEFHLEDRVSAAHLLRRIDIFAAAALADLRQKLADHYSHTGRPSIDPELLIRMLIVGYCYGIRSERRLCEEVEDRLAFRWFCRLDLDDKVPNHSTFSKNRHGRFRDSDVLRHVFERVVLACITAGLVGGEGFAVDASLIEADANKGRSIPGSEWSKERDPATANHAVKEYLATLDDAAFGAATEVVPKFVSPSDPAAQWTGAMKSAAFFAYADNYLIDVKAGIIVDVEASRAIRQAEVGAARTMIDRTEQRFGLKPKLLAADTAYGSAPMLNWLVEEKGIAPHIPVIDKSAREDGSFSRTDFRYDEDDNVYICPANKALRTSGTIVNDEQRLYRGATADCRSCPLKPRCCPKGPVRKIPRSIYEAARDVARSLFGTEAYAQSRRDRKKVEMQFAHLKRILRLNRLRLRGPCGAKDEFLLAATAQNLRKLAKLLIRPPPDHRAACVAYA